MTGRQWWRSYRSRHRWNRGNAGKPCFSRLFPCSHLFPRHTAKVEVKTPPPLPRASFVIGSLRGLALITIDT